MKKLTLFEVQFRWMGGCVPLTAYFTFVPTPDQVIEAFEDLTLPMQERVRIGDYRICEVTAFQKED